MRQIKLPHLPSDIEERKSDLMTDLWYKGKETQIKQDTVKVKIRMSDCNGVTGPDWGRSEVVFG